MSTDEQENQIHAEMSRPCPECCTNTLPNVVSHFFANIFLPMVFFPLSKLGLTKSQPLFTLRWHIGIRFGQTEP